MNNVDNIIKSINGQVLKLQEELKLSIGIAITNEEIDNIIKYINENISNNPSLNHISSNLIKIAEQKKKEISKKPNKKVSRFDDKWNSVVISPYIEIKDYPSFLPFVYWFFMRHALWHLACADAKDNEKESSIAYFNGYLESILDFCRDEKDKEELIAFFKNIANIGGFAKDYYPTISRIIMDFSVNKKRSNSLQALGNEPYKNVSLDFPFLKNNKIYNQICKSIIDKMSEIETSKEYVVYWQNDKGKRLINKSSLAELISLISIIINYANNEKDLTIIENEFKKFDNTFGKEFYNMMVSPLIIEKRKKLTSSSKFKNVSNKPKQNYYLEDIKNELDKIERDYDEFLEKTKKYVETGDLDELDVFVLRLQKLNTELDSLYSFIDDKKEYVSLSERIDKDIKIVRKKREMIDNLINEVNKIDFDL